MTLTFKPKAPIWCAGCGHFGVHTALTHALKAAHVPAHEALIIAGIGCSGSIQNNLNAYGYHALHGRVLPTATGAALANPNLLVIGAGGDGDGYAIGGGHLLHSFKRNPSLVYIVMNNGVYGLTKGQNSPTAGAALTNGEAPLDAVQLGLSVSGSTFIARGFVGWWDQLAALIREGIQHARAHCGFAFIEAISPCVTYNDSYPEWDGKLADISQDKAYDPADRVQAMSRVMRLSEQGKLAVGKILHTTGSTLDQRHNVSAQRAPALQGVLPANNVSTYEAIARDHLV